MELQPGLMLVHGNRAEQLRDVLVAWLRGNPLEPLENECLLVHSNGVAQWLRLALAQSDTGCGVAAALDFLLPSRFIWQAYRTVLGEVPQDSPLDKDPLTWRLVRLLPQCAEQPGYAPLQRFLADDADVRKRYQLARRLADLFDQYQVYRADWLQAWAKGELILPDVRGGHIDLSEDQAWQARLWQALLADLGADENPIGRAAIHEAFMAKVRAAAVGEPRPTGLPRRVVVFGVSSMPRQTLEALAGLARWVQILVCVNNPCAHYWADIQGDRDLLRARFRRQQRRPNRVDVQDEAELHQQTQPLLASWGRQGRDFMGLLDDFDDPEFRARCGGALAALHHRIDSFDALPGATLLEQLQDDIRDLRPLEETQALWPPIDPMQDTSMCFQSAHSAQREVEILHDHLLAAFAADPTLRPRDVIVMVPDIEAYAPHVQAVFGLHEGRDWRHIPYALADRGQRHADPLVIVLEQLLSLPRLRLGVQEVLEWLDVPAVRARFGVADEDLPRLQRWARESNVRWGLDAQQRASFNLHQSAEAAHQYTWAFGLQRMLLGYAAGAEAGPWNGIEPYDEPGGLQAAALGGLARLLERIGQTWRSLCEPAAPEVWVARCRDLLEDFFLPVTDEDEHTLMRFRQCLQDWQQLCDDAGVVEALPVAVVAEHCLSELDQGGLSQRFFAGAVTFATLMPMRAIPFRRVCLLGMQDGAYPRSRVPADFDLMAIHTRSGDRSRREDDRYLFLEALLSARDQLYVSWVGQDIHDNTEQAPSVLVSQLLEHLDRGWVCVNGGPVSEALTCRHPLQPFSRRYFPLDPQAGPQALFTFASEWRNPLAAPDAGFALSSQDAQLASVHLDDLVRFLRDPVRVFFQERLRVRFEASESEPEDVEPYSRDGLASWKLRQSLLDEMQRSTADHDTDGLGRVFESGLARLQRQGDLVSGSLGQWDADALRDTLADPLSGYAEACARWPERVDDPLRLESSLTPGSSAEPILFADTLAGWRRNTAGEWCRIHLVASDLVDRKSHYRLAIMLQPWLEHVCAQAHGRPLTTLILSPKGRVTFGPGASPSPAGDFSWSALWASLWSARAHGLCGPAPVEAHTASLWLRTGQSTDPESKVWSELHDCYAQRRDKSLYLRRSYPDFDALVADNGFFEWARMLYGALDQMLGHSPDGKDGGA
ncbi:MAG TPA: exodeoxyribonuclease V subunit gamma [Castellaniella sp.]|uniref:exodeoxyribonuclease V subunit gamma n=1 Tax=Castellaniella sp. TaxID=1955812 RepID=UPI002F0ACA2F